MEAYDEGKKYWVLLLLRREDVMFAMTNSGQRIKYPIGCGFDFVGRDGSISEAI